MFNIDSDNVVIMIIYKMFCVLFLRLEIVVVDFEVIFCEILVSNLVGVLLIFFM